MSDPAGRMDAKEANETDDLMNEMMERTVTIQIPQVRQCRLDEEARALASVSSLHTLVCLGDTSVTMPLASGF